LRVGSVRVAQILAGVGDGVADVTTLPQRLVMACALALPVTGVGMVLMTESGPAGSVAVTDPTAGTMEELQFTLGEGPCVESSATGRPVLQPDLARTGPARWPGFCAGALEAGIAAIFALPLRVGGIRLGVLDLYRDKSGDLTDGELADALSFADAATSVLLSLQAYGDAGGAGGAAIPVLEDRAEVHQAAGMVSVQAGVSLGEAMVLVRARAFAMERPVLDLARDVVARVVTFVPGRDDGDGR
jgi:GAF domain-containing protein